VIKIAIATTAGHVQRAIDFYNKSGKYFVIGGTEPWSEEANPPAPDADSYKLNDIVGLKLINKIELVVPDNENGKIEYGDNQSWREVPISIRTLVAPAGIASGSTIVPLTDMTGIVVGCKLRIGNAYEGKVTAVTYSPANSVTLDTAAPSSFVGGTVIEGGALVEGAKYVYMECTLERNEFPTTNAALGGALSYRQIGIMTGVTPANQNTLLSSAYSQDKSDEYTSLGTLEILDNRAPTTRDADQSESLAYICEF